MADHSSSDETGTTTPSVLAVPDYELEDQLVLDADQIKLLLNSTRRMIIDLLSERAATTSQLADVLERPKGTVGHHCKALEAGGLIHVVRTGRVRAIEERYYGRTARLYVMHDFEGHGVSFASAIDESYAELRKATTAPSDPSAAHIATARYARIPAERAAEWANRFGELADEFAAQERDGEQIYGVLLGVFVTDRKGFG